MVEAGHLSFRNGGDARAMDVSPLDAELLDATVRLMRLLDRPLEVRVVRPLITREIVYRLLMGEQGARLRHLALLGGQSESIAEAIERLRREFNQPLRIESIARQVGMSVSGFHHQFKAVTAMSPLQFQKQLRLRRRLAVQPRVQAAVRPAADAGCGAAAGGGAGIGPESTSRGPSPRRRSVAATPLTGTGASGPSSERLSQLSAAADIHPRHSLR
jgi:hypothetical protein